MRRQGHDVVDWLIDQLERMSTGPVLCEATEAEMRRLLPSDVPADPLPLDALLTTLHTDVIPFSGVWGHPRFFGYIPGNGTWPGALADFIVSACNLDASTWREAAGLSRIEQVVVDWMKEWMGYPSEAEGILVSGGSAANMTALAVARHLADVHDGIVYLSDQAHSSLARAARVLGFGSDRIRVLPTDGSFRMRPDLLARAVEADVRRGLRPLAAIAAAGSTNTGAVDPFDELADVCEQHDLWFHVDAAYGGFAILTERGRQMMGGIERADSITVDPHKWLYQPFECGGLLVRHPGALADTFRITPPYLEDGHGAGAADFSNMGMQLSRSSRALKVWMSVSHLGLDAFRDAIDESMSLARHAQSRIQDDGRFELLSPAHLSVVCFRRVAPGLDDAGLEELNAGLVAELAASGLGLVSSTRLGGTYAIRMCVFNHSTTRHDVDAVLDWLATAQPPTAAIEDAGAWPAANVRCDIRTHPLLSGLDPSVVDHIVGTGREQHVPAGWVVVEELAIGNELYLLLEGVVGVSSEGREVAQLHAGDFFGEMAAVDWGAGYGSPRMATVAALEDCRLFAVPGAILNRAMRSSPALRRRIERTAAIRRPELDRRVDGAADG